MTCIGSHGIWGNKTHFGGHFLRSWCKVHPSSLLCCLIANNTGTFQYPIFEIYHMWDNEHAFFVCIPANRGSCLVCWTAILDMDEQCTNGMMTLQCTFKVESQTASPVQWNPSDIFLIAFHQWLIAKACPLCNIQ